MIVPYRTGISSLEILRYNARKLIVRPHRYRLVRPTCHKPFQSVFVGILYILMLGNVLKIEIEKLWRAKMEDLFKIFRIILLCYRYL